jgi:hypothetical protein
MYINKKSIMSSKSRNLSSIVCDSDEKSSVQERMRGQEGERVEMATGQGVRVREKNFF